MRSRLMIVAAVAIAAACVAFAVTQAVSSSSGLALAGTSLPTGQASYLGVYENGPPHTYQPVAEFASVVGRQPNLVLYYRGWGQHFDAGFAKAAASHGAQSQPAPVAAVDEGAVPNSSPVQSDSTMG